MFVWGLWGDVLSSPHPQVVRYLMFPPASAPHSQDPKAQGLSVGGRVTLYVSLSPSKKKLNFEKEAENRVRGGSSEDLRWSLMLVLQQIEADDILPRGRRLESFEFEGGFVPDLG